MTLVSTQTRLHEALSRLLAGQPTATDGELTVSNLCKEAGVGRDSYYRTPQIVEKFTAARANAHARKPELIQLRDQIAALKREIKQLKRDQTEQTSQLEETIQIYANQIQVLALRNEELEEDNRRLRERVERDDKDIIKLTGRD